MAYNLKFAERIRTEMKGLPVIEKKMVEPEGYKTAKQLSAWAKLGVEFAASLPPK